MRADSASSTRMRALTTVAKVGNRLPRRLQGSLDLVTEPVGRPCLSTAHVPAT